MKMGDWLAYTVVADQMQGLCQEWNRDGILIFEGEYDHDLKNGKFNKYYDDGSPKLLAYYNADQLVGERKSFPET